MMRSLVKPARSLAFATATMFVLSWIAPSASAQSADKGVTKQRSGEAIVRAQCAACHESGKAGAPKIGDRGAWIARASGASMRS
jgi:cytochrome c5